MNHKSSAHSWCAFDAQSDDARIREARKGASRPLITFDGASNTQEVQIRDEYRPVILSGPLEKRTEGDAIIRVNVGAMPTAHSIELAVYTDRSRLQNGTSGNGRVNGGRPNGSHPTVGRSNGTHPNVGRFNGGRSNGSRVNGGGLGGKANRNQSRQAGRGGSSAAWMAGSPDSTSLTDPPASPTMTVAEWEEDEDVAEPSLAGLSLGAPSSFDHEAEDLIDMA